MKKILLSLAAVGAIAAAAAPAAAQTWDGYGSGYGADHGRYDAHRDDANRDGDRGGRTATPYLDRLNWKITNAAREGRIPWDEARALRHEVREIQPIAWRVQTGQANGWETARLQRTVSRVEQAVDNRAPRYDDHDRYDGQRR